MSGNSALESSLHENFDLHQAATLARSGDYEKADEVLTDLIDRILGKDSMHVAEAFNDRGVVRRMLQRYDDAREDYESALNSDPNCEETALALINLADIDRLRGNYEGAHALLDEARTHLHEVSWIAAKLFDQRGLVYRADGNLEMAATEHAKATRIGRRLVRQQPMHEESEIYARALMNLAVDIRLAYEQSQDEALLDEALVHLSKAITIHKRLGNEQGVVNAARTIGDLAAIKGDFEPAEQHYRKAWEILEQTGYERARASLALDRAFALYHMGKIKEGRAFLGEFHSGVEAEHLTASDLKEVAEKRAKVEALYSN